MKLLFLLLLIFPALHSDAAVVLFSRTQTAIQTPFEPLRNPGFGGGPSLLTSSDVQNAIEEVRVFADTSSKGFIFASYGGNANTGRYLEFFPTIDSNDAPVQVIGALEVLTIVARSTASATCTIGFYNNTTLLYTTTFTAVTNVTTVGTPIFTLPALGLLKIKIDSGSINKPHLYIIARGG